MGRISKSRGEAEKLIKGKKILAIIPARGGSKGIPKKNIVNLAGKPLISWTIEAAKNSKFIDKLIVSTDSEEIAEVAKNNNVEVPYLRPANLAEDTSPGIAPVFHALDKINANFDYVMLLQPTSPLRNESHIDSSVEYLIKHNYKTVVSVVDVAKHPNWMFKKVKNGSIRRFLSEEFNTTRQENEQLIIPNGAIYISDITTLRSRGSFYHDDTYPFPMDALDSIDIDTIADLKLAELCLRQFDSENYNEILESYLAQGFGNIMKRELDHIIFRQITEDYLRLKYRSKNKLNFHLVENNDIYLLSEKLKVPVSKIKSLINHTAYRYSKTNFNEVQQSLVRLFNDQITSQRELKDGIIRLSIQNDYLRQEVERFFYLNGTIIDYSFNRNILVIELYSLLFVLSKNDKNKLIATINSSRQEIGKEKEATLDEIMRYCESDSSNNRKVIFREIFKSVSSELVTATIMKIVNMIVA